MVSILMGSGGMMVRKKGETIEKHIQRFKEAEQRRKFVNNANYDAQQEAIKEAQQ